MLDFQRYQQAFTAHIRHPKAHKKPAGVSSTGTAVYREIVFNNLLSAVSACFPVCQQVLGKRAWLKLVRQFLSQHQANTPIFREIPEQFLLFLTMQDSLPAFLWPLAHYEWIELALSSQVTTNQHCSCIMQLLDEIPILAPAHRLLQYDYAVHQISAKYKPKHLHKTYLLKKTYLLVFRNTEYKIKFIVLNATTFMLLKTIEGKQLTGRQALLNLSEQLKNDGNLLEPSVITHFGLEILQDLATQQALIGSVSPL